MNNGARNRFLIASLPLLISFSHCYRIGTNSLPELAFLGATDGATTSFISGSVTGLVTNSIILQNNTADNLTVSANGSFAFSTMAAVGDTYNVTILTQPADVFCFVQNGSGTFSGTAAGIVVTCPLAIVSGLTYMRCTYGQTWNSATGDCTGTGNSGNSYGATLVQFCSVTGDQCNSGFDGGPLTDGSAFGQTSTLYLACNSFNASSTYGINSWRVAAKNEFENIESCSTGQTAPDVNGDYLCNPGSAAPTVIANYFTNTVSSTYSSGTADGCCFNAYWAIRYSDGTVTRSQGSKTVPSYTRCVSP